MNTYLGTSLKKEHSFFLQIKEALEKICTKGNVVLWAIYPYTRDLSKTTNMIEIEIIENGLRDEYACTWKKDIEYFLQKAVTSVFPNAEIESCSTHKERMEMVIKADFNIGVINDELDKDIKKALSKSKEKNQRATLALDRKYVSKDKEYPDYWGEDVQIDGEHNFLRNEVAPLLEKLGYKRANHYSWNIHFQRIVIHSASKTTLEFEKGTFKSDCMSSSQSYFKTKIITIEDIKEKIKEIGCIA